MYLYKFLTSAEATLVTTSGPNVRVPRPEAVEAVADVCSVHVIARDIPYTCTDPQGAFCRAGKRPLKSRKMIMYLLTLCAVVFLCTVGISDMLILHVMVDSG